MKFMSFFQFLFDFLNEILGIFFIKIAKKGIYLPVGDDVASESRWRADVARGTTAQMRRGTEATWPMQGAGGA